LICFWLAQPAPRSLAGGALLAAVGLSIRAAAAGRLRKHEALATAGPYAWTRNPLYFGSMFLAAGFLLAAGSWPAAALAAAYLAVFYPGVIRREEQELRAQYGAAFEDYARRVPLFWPWAPRVRIASVETFSWSQYRRNREYQALFGTIVAFGILVARMMWRTG
jgi:hypothetical protein